MRYTVVPLLPLDHAVKSDSAGSPIRQDVRVGLEFVLAWLLDAVQLILASAAVASPPEPRVRSKLTELLAWLVMLAYALHAKGEITIRSDAVAEVECRRLRVE